MLKGLDIYYILLYLLFLLSDWTECWIPLKFPNTLVSSLIWEFIVVGDLLCGTESIRV